MADAPQVYLNRIATRVPEHEMHTKFLQIILTLIESEVERRIFQRLAAKAQISRRFSIFNIDPEGDAIDVDGIYKLGSFPSTTERMRLFEQEAFALAAPAVEELLGSDGSPSTISPDQVTHLIVTTCTGATSPGLDIEIQQRLGLRSNVERTMIGFMGCNAAINSLKTAWHIVRSTHEAKVLIVNIELCSLHFQDWDRKGPIDFEQLLASLQFADGCAASLVSSDPCGLRICRFHCETLPEAIDLIQWRIRDQGFLMRLDLSVSPFLRGKLPEVWKNVMSREERDEVRLWAIHPGGRAILDTVQQGLDLRDDEIAPSRAVLRDYGNMSSPSIVFVLKDLLENPHHVGNGVGLAFGPGLALETVIFDKQIQ